MVAKPAIIEFPPNVFRRFADDRAANQRSAPAGYMIATSTATTVTATGPGGEEAEVTVMASSEYEALMELVEDMEATAAYFATRDEESIPAEMVDALLDGENPVRVWRKHRGLTQQALATAAAKSKSYISEIEKGIKAPSVKTLKAIAKVLDCDLDDLV